MTRGEAAHRKAEPSCGAVHGRGQEDRKRELSGTDEFEEDGHHGLDAGNPARSLLERQFLRRRVVRGVVTRQHRDRPRGEPFPEGAALGFRAERRVRLREWVAVRSRPQEKMVGGRLAGDARRGDPVDRFGKRRMGDVQPEGLRCAKEVVDRLRFGLRRPGGVPPLGRGRRDGGVGKGWRPFRVDREGKTGFRRRREDLRESLGRCLLDLGRGREVEFQGAGDPSDRPDGGGGRGGPVQDNVDGDPAPGEARLVLPSLGRVDGWCGVRHLPDRSHSAERGPLGTARERLGWVRPARVPEVHMDVGRGGEEHGVPVVDPVARVPEIPTDAANPTVPVDAELDRTELAIEPRPPRDDELVPAARLGAGTAVASPRARRHRGPEDRGD